MTSPTLTTAEVAQDIADTEAELKIWRARLPGYEILAHNPSGHLSTDMMDRTRLMRCQYEISEREQLLLRMRAIQEGIIK